MADFHVIEINCRICLKPMVFPMQVQLLGVPLISHKKATQSLGHPVAQWIPLVSSFFVGKGSPEKSTNQERMPFFSHGHWASEVSFDEVGVHVVGFHVKTGCRQTKETPWRWHCFQLPL